VRRRGYIHLRHVAHFSRSVFMKKNSPDSGSGVIVQPDDLGWAGDKGEQGKVAIGDTNAVIPRDRSRPSWGAALSDTERRCPASISPSLSLPSSPLPRVPSLPLPSSPSSPSSSSSSVSCLSPFYPPFSHLPCANSCASLHFHVNNRNVCLSSFGSVQSVQVRARYRCQSRGHGQ
jgi:hypothetical protein